MKMIPYLHSCLKEFIQTALERYEQMGYLEIRAYTNSRGTNTIFLQSPREQAQNVGETLKSLSSHRQVSKETKDAIFELVE